MITAVGRAVAYPDAIDSLVVLEPLSGMLEGDLNGDGFVGIHDLDILLARWNQTVPMGDPGQGDPSGDGYVGIDDLDRCWATGTGARRRAMGRGSSPEPGSLVLLGAVGVILFKRCPPYAE